MTKRAHRLTRVLVGAGAVVAMLAFALPAGADLPEEALPSLTVQKVVVTPQYGYDVTEEFIVTVSCEPTLIDKAGVSEPWEADLFFNPDGTPAEEGAPEGWVDTGTAWTLQDWGLKRMTCTVTEDVTEGLAEILAAGSPTYDCSFTTEQYVPEEVEPISEGYDESMPPGCLSGDEALPATSGTDPAVVRIGSPWDHSCIEKEPVLESEGEGWCLCVESATVVVTNTIAEDPAKVLAAQAAKPIAVTPAFTG